MTLPGLIFWIWMFAILVCVMFGAWYFNWRGALSPSDIERYMAQVDSNPNISVGQRATVHAFLSNDDGKEFVMLNVIKFHGCKQPHPITGEPTAPLKLLSEYQKHFLGNLFKSAGHPFLYMWHGKTVATLILLGRRRRQNILLRRWCVIARAGISPTRSSILDLQELMHIRRRPLSIPLTSRHR